GVGFTGPDALPTISAVISMTAGTMFLVWLGELITENGIGNGISLIITIGILARLPVTVQSVYYMFDPPGDAPTQYNLFHGIALLLLLVAVVAGVVAVTQAQRKIPVQYAQRSVGRKVIPGGTSFMPLRVNYAGVMPIIFAQAILMFPERLFSQLGQTWDVEFLVTLGRQFQMGSMVYLLVYATMVMFFSYFWVATQFNEIQISDDLKKHGGYIPGVRPGAATTSFLHNTMSRITLAGSIFLTVIAVIPIVMSNSMNISFEVSQFFGGTSVLIAVGVMLDTMRQMESHLMMRHYDGFLKRRSGGSGPRLRGRF
ncbi:MAG: preprotein translocase subunit SecY, partial [Pseudanabaenales cyanobacterium]|nr:preprotein translocase subunit SecY [Pseudanabaenales cyanobacterium]